PVNLCHTNKMKLTATKRLETLRSLRTSAFSAFERFFRRRERGDTQRAQRKLMVVGLCALMIVACNSSEPNTNTPVVTAPPATTFPMPPVSGTSIVNMGWELADGKRS